MEFSTQAWRARTTKRLNAAQRRSKRDAAVLLSIERLIAWCKQQGYSVGFKRTRSIIPHGERTVNINECLVLEHQLFELAHECGHVLIDSTKPCERFRLGWDADKDPKVNRTLQHRLNVLDEEFEAWRRGRSLMGRLRIRVDDRAFHAFRARCLTTYVRWVMKPDDFKGEDDDEETS